MFGITILDTAIGLIFVYLLLSLICSVVNEWIAALFSRRRPRNLVYGLRNLLDPPDPIDNNGERKKVVLHPPGDPDFPLIGTLTCRDAEKRSVDLPVRAVCEEGGSSGIWRFPSSPMALPLRLRIAE